MVNRVIYFLLSRLAYIAYHLSNHFAPPVQTRAPEPVSDAPDAYMTGVREGARLALIQVAITESMQKLEHNRIFS